MQKLAVPLQRALAIGLQQPRMAEVALAALESCPHQVAVSLAPLVGPAMSPYLTPVTHPGRVDEETETGGLQNAEQCVAVASSSLIWCSLV